MRSNPPLVEQNERPMLSLATVADPSGYGDEDLVNTLRHISGFLRANTTGAEPGFVAPFHARLAEAFRRLAPALCAQLQASLPVPCVNGSFNGFTSLSAIVRR